MQLLSNFFPIRSSEDFFKFYVKYLRLLIFIIFANHSYAFASVSFVANNTTLQKIEEGETLLTEMMDRIKGTNLISLHEADTDSYANELDLLYHEFSDAVLAERITISELLNADTSPDATLFSEHHSRNTLPHQVFLFSGVTIENRNVIEYAYSGRNIESTQGKFIISNAINLYHTEPKALAVLFQRIAVLTPSRKKVNKVILISQKEMCPCCSRLILSILQAKRREENFPKSFFAIDEFILSEIGKINHMRIKTILPKLVINNRRSDSLSEENLLRALRERSLEDFLRGKEVVLGTEAFESLTRLLVLQYHINDIRSRIQSDSGNKLVLMIK